MVEKGKSENYKGYLAYLYPVLLFFLFLNLYILTLSANYNFDGVVFSLFLKGAIIKGNPFLHLHYQHLIFQPLSFALYRMFSLKIDPLIFLQILDSVMGAGSASIFYLLSYRISKDKLMSFFLSLSLGFCFSTWFFSTDAEVHIFSIFFVLFSLLFLEEERYTLSAIFASVAVLFHITNIIFLGALWLYKGRKIFYYSLPILSIYLFVPFIRGKQFLAWLFSHFENSPHSWFSLPGVKDLLSDFLSFAKTLTPFFLFSVPLFFISLALIYKFRLKLFWYWLSFVFLFFLFWQPGNFEFKAVIVPAILIVFAYVKRKELSVIISILLFVFNFSFFLRRARPENNSAMKLSMEIASVTEPDAYIYIDEESKKLIIQKAYLPYFFSRRASFWRGEPSSCSIPSYLLSQRLLPIKGMTLSGGALLYNICQ